MYQKYLIDKSLYIKAKNRYTELVNKKQYEFEKTQPGASNYENEKVAGGVYNNKWDKYIDATAELDKEITVAEEIMKARRLILELSEQDVRESKETIDKIFVARFLEHKKVYQITAIVNYSERQVVRYLRNIREYMQKIED